MTRTRHHLHLLVPQRFYVSQQSSRGDRHVYASISRFIPESVRDRFVDVGPAAPPAVEEAAPTLPAADIAARIRATWR